MHQNKAIQNLHESVTLLKDPQVYEELRYAGGQQLKVLHIVAGLSVSNNFEFIRLLQNAICQTNERSLNSKEANIKIDVFVFERQQTEDKQQFSIEFEIFIVSRGSVDLKHGRKELSTWLLRILNIL